MAGRYYVVYQGKQLFLPSPDSLKLSIKFKEQEAIVDVEMLSIRYVDELNKTIERINYLILNKNTVYFVEEKTSGSIITFEAKINTIEYKNGTILKLKSYGTWALTNNVEDRKSVV